LRKYWFEKLKPRLSLSFAVIAEVASFNGF